MFKKFFLILILSCTGLKSFVLPDLCAQQFVAGTLCGPAAVCAFYAFIVHPFLNNDSKKPRAETIIILGAGGLYGIAAVLFLKQNTDISKDFLAGTGLSAALFAYWVNYKIIVLENPNN
jgi:hypothetical protein